MRETTAPEVGAVGAVALPPSLRMVALKPSRCGRGWPEDRLPPGLGRHLTTSNDTASVAFEILVGAAGLHAQALFRMGFSDLSSCVVRVCFLITVFMTLCHIFIFVRERRHLILTA